MFYLAIAAFCSNIIFILLMLRQKKLYVYKQNHLKGQIEEYNDRYRILLAELDTLKELLSAKPCTKEEINSIYYNFELFNQSYPLLEELSKKITDETEKTAIRLSNDLQALTRGSVKAGKEITESLANVYDEDNKKLKIDLDTVVRIVDNIESVTVDFNAMTIQFEEHMKQIDSTVNNVFSSMSNITDLSEQTHLLSINASVVASRLGQKGLGFDIIASEVQKLAGKSKNIAVDSSNMITLLRNELYIINEYFADALNNINLEIETLNNSKRELHLILDQLQQQVSNVSTSVEKSKSLSQFISKQLGKVTYSLQFQDITQQQINNMLGIINELRIRMETGFRENNCPQEIDFDDVAQKVEKIASSRFTVRGEWQSIGKEVEKDENLIENKKDLISENLEGDIVIFK